MSLPPASSITVQRCGETLELLAERAVYWAKQNELWVADLHWGKEAAFQRQGLNISQAGLSADLARLGRLVDQYEIHQLVVLGDLIHGPAGLTPWVRQEVERWFAQRAPTFTMRLVLGNHDRFDPAQLGWPLHVNVAPYLRGPFALTHNPGGIPHYYTWAGHLHPTCWIEGRRDRLRLPCFALGRQGAILPAFSHFTRGVVLKREASTQYYVLSEGPDHSAGIIQI